MIKIIKLSNNIEEVNQTLATLQTSDTSLSSKSPFEGRRHWQHISLLSALMLLSLAIYIILF